MRKNITKNMLLTDHIRANLKDPAALEKMKPQTKAKFYFDQRQKVRDCVEYLTFMLDHLPEKQLKQVSNKETMKPLFEALFRLQGENRQRITELWRIALIDVANLTYIITLVGRERWQMFMQPTAKQLQALYSTVMFES